MYSLIIVVVILIHFNPSDAAIEANGSWLCSASCNNNSIVKIEADSNTQTAQLTCNDAMTSNWTTNYKFYYADKTYVTKTLTYQSVYHMINGSLFFSGTAKTNLKGCGDVLVAITLKTNPSNPVNCSSKPTSVTTISSILVKGQNCLATCNGSVTVKYTSGVQQTPPQSCPIPPSSSANPTPVALPNARGNIVFKCDANSSILKFYWKIYFAGYQCDMNRTTADLNTVLLTEFRSRIFRCIDIVSSVTFNFKDGGQNFTITGKMGGYCANTTIKISGATPGAKKGDCNTKKGLESMSFKDVKLIANGSCEAECEATKFNVEYDPPIRNARFH